MDSWKADQMVQQRGSSMAAYWAEHWGIQKAVEREFHWVDQRVQMKVC